MACCVAATPSWHCFVARCEMFKLRDIGYATAAVLLILLGEWLYQGHAP